MGLLDLIKGYGPQKAKELPYEVTVGDHRYTRDFHVRLNLGPLALEEGYRLQDFFARHFTDSVDGKSGAPTRAMRHYEIPGPEGASIKISTNMANVTVEGKGLVLSAGLLEPQQTLQRVLWSYSKEFEGKRFSPVKEDEADYAEFYLSGDLRRKGRADRMKRGASARKLLEASVRDKLAVEFIYAGKRNDSQKPHWVNLRDSSEDGFRGDKAHGVRRFSWNKLLSARLMDSPTEKLPEELVLLLDFSADEAAPLRVTLTKLLKEDRILGLDPVSKKQ